MHRHPIIRRWADLDSLNHVNNVRYAEWSKDALLAAQRDGEIPLGALWPAQITITYRRPVLLKPARIWIETTLTDDHTIEQTITEGHGDERVEYATIETVLATEPGSFAPPIESDPAYPVAVRRIEAAVDGRIDYPRLFEYFQEARIFALWKALDTVQAGSFVIGRILLLPGTPLTWRPEPYPAHTWIGRVGRSSIDLVSQLRDGDTVMSQATATLVAFDLPAQSSRPLTDEELESYRRLVPDEGVLNPGR